MDVRTPTLILLGFLLAALALSVLGLAADNISYVHSHQDEQLQIHYIRWNQTADTQYSYWLKMDYTPSRFTLGRQSALLVNGIICTIAGAGAIATAFIMRKESARSFRFSPWLISLILMATAFAISLAVTIYAWYPVMKWNIDFLKSLPTPPSVSGGAASSSGAVTYQSPFAFTPDVWNCFIAPYVVDTAQSGRLQALCHEAHAAKYLTIPVLLLAAALVTVVSLSWWKGSSAASTKVEAAGKEVEEVSIQSQD